MGVKEVSPGIPPPTPTLQDMVILKIIDSMLQFCVLVLITKEFKSQNFLLSGKYMVMN